MTLPIFIPSRGRATRKAVEAGPLASVPAGRPVTYVVPHGELEAYKALGVPVIPRPEHVTNIGMSRHFIGQCARDWGYDKFIMFDDDLHFFTRVDDGIAKLRKSDHSDMNKMLDSVEYALEEYGQVGISARTGNNRAGEGEAPIAKVNTRTNGCTAYRTEDFLSVEHNRITFMEDFDVTLQLLRKGIANVCLYYWAYDQSMTNAAGGCSTYRTHAAQDQSARTLQSLHPEFVRLRQKENKTGGEFGTRTEVTVSWKKAFESASKPLPLAAVPTARAPLTCPPPPPKKA